MSRHAEDLELAPKTLTTCYASRHIGMLVMKSLKKFVRNYFPRYLLNPILALHAEWCYMRKRDKFIGTSVYCPCCNKYFSNFETFRFNAEFCNPDSYKSTPLDIQCPYCQSFPRHRIVINYLMNNNILSQTSMILVFAIPRAYMSWLDRNGFHYISADLYDRTAQKKMDIQNIPFSDDTFDFISCDHVLEHVPDYIAALKELRRVIKVGGCVEITVPLLSDMGMTYENSTITNPQDRILAFGQADHLRIFGADFYCKLKSVGFDVSIYDGDACDKNIMPLIAPAIYDYNKIFLCKKSYA